MTKDNRTKVTIEDEKNLQEILNDESPIEEDVSTKVNVTDEDVEEDNNEEDFDSEDQVEEADTEEDVEEDVEEDTPDPVDPEIDYKEKFRASSREATTQYFKNKKFQDTVEEAKNLPEPTEDELKAYAKTQGTDYEELDTFAQNILRKTFVNERRFEMIYETSSANKDLDAWADKVDSFVNSPETLAKYSSISDHEVEFKKYCMKEARRGMDMEDLVASYLYKVQADSPRPKKKVKRGKSMLLKGGGAGGEGLPKPKELSADEARKIRKMSPDRYKRLIKEGKIGLDLLDRE